MMNHTTNSCNFTSLPWCNFLLFQNTNKTMHIASVSVILNGSSHLILLVSSIYSNSEAVTLSNTNSREALDLDECIATILTDYHTRGGWERKFKKLTQQYKVSLCLIATVHITLANFDDFSLHQFWCRFQCRLISHHLFPLQAATEKGRNYFSSIFSFINDH